MAEHEARHIQHDSNSGVYSHNGHNGGSDHTHLDKDMPPGDALNRMRTAGSISISPELFEKLYLSPQNNVKGDLRKTFGNPTPMYVKHYPQLPSQPPILFPSSLMTTTNHH